jgi:hypothetical protein
VVNACSSAEGTFVDALAIVAVREDDDGCTRRRMGEKEILPPSVIAPLPKIALSVHLFDPNA